MPLFNYSFDLGWFKNYSRQFTKITIQFFSFFIQEFLYYVVLPSLSSRDSDFFSFRWIETLAFLVNGMKEK